jgi:PIN domain nuclease of toxin-antitoxin system
MKLLLDTHTLVWWLTDDAKLLASARIAISNCESFTVVTRDAAITELGATTLW